MSTPSPYTKAEQEFLGQVAGFASRHAQNKLFMTTIYSQSLGTPVLMIIALGEQAEALQHLVLENRAPVSKPEIEIVKNLDNVDAGKW
jgi:hypothetical protein